MSPPSPHDQPGLVDSLIDRSDFRREILVTILVIVAAFIILTVMGRDVWCGCGGWEPWAGDIWSRHNSQHLFDPYSFTHVLHGIILCGGVWWWSKGRLTWRGYTACLLVETIWEILENSPFIIERYREATISLDYYGDSVLNSVVDILACAAGYQLARKIGFKWSVTVIVATELILLMTIRDCLTLNVLMLIYPLDAVKAWQMG